MKIIISSRAEKQLKKITKTSQIIIAKKIRSLTSPKTKGEKLKGYKDIEKIRVGDYRIVYKKFKSKIYIILIVHRKDIYDEVKRVLG